MIVDKPHLGVRVVGYVDPWGCNLNLSVFLLLNLIFKIFPPFALPFVNLHLVFAYFIIINQLEIDNNNGLHVPFQNNYLMVCFTIHACGFLSNFLIV
jgi:hypothetical protein